MKLVVDTNIVFSTLLNPHSTIGEILMNVQDDLEFYAPELLISELSRYSRKIKAYSKLDAPNLALIEELIFTRISLISENAISGQSWTDAIRLAADIDEDDTPFLALAIELKAKLWTGDKALTAGLQQKNIDLIISTTELKVLLGKN